MKPAGVTGTVQIALLRAVNVGGRNPVAMSDLRAFLAELGFTAARSLVQSGNLVFAGGAPAGVELERLLEAQAAKRLELRADFFVRNAAEWQRIIARNPFSDEAKRDPGHLVLVVLKDAPNAAGIEALQAASSGPEILRADGKQLYIVYPAGQGRSRLTNALIEKKLATRGTARNWNTVLKLAALCAAVRPASKDVKP